VWLILGRFLVLPGHSSRPRSARRDSEMWIISKVLHLQRHSALLCAPLITGVALVMSQMHCRRPILPFAPFPFQLRTLSTRSAGRTGGITGMSCPPPGGGALIGSLKTKRAPFKDHPLAANCANVIPFPSSSHGVVNSYLVAGARPIIQRRTQRITKALCSATSSQAGRFRVPDLHGAMFKIYRRETAAPELDLLPPNPPVPFNRSGLDAEGLSMH
jgi:hypothetical protein